MNEVGEILGPGAGVGGVEEGLDGLDQTLQMGDDRPRLVQAGGRERHDDPASHLMGDGMFPGIPLQERGHAGEEVHGRGVRGRRLADGDLEQPEEGGEDEGRLLGGEDAMLRKGDVTGQEGITGHAGHEIDHLNVHDLGPVDQRPQMEQGRQILLGVEMTVIGRGRSGRHHQGQETGDDEGALDEGGAEVWEDISQDGGRITWVEIHLREGTELGQGPDVALERGRMHHAGFLWQDEHLELSKQWSPVQGQVIDRAKIMLLPG